MDLPVPLVSPSWLRSHLGEPGLVVADVRWVPGGSAHEAYESGHIPGAVFVDLDRDLAAPPFTGGPEFGRHPLPSPESFSFADLLSRALIGPDTPVVAYDDAGGSHAARLWWMLDAIGHRRVAVLDGALASWDGPVEAGSGPWPVTIATGARRLPPWPEEMLADSDDVASGLRSGRSLVLDARAPERYRGEIEPIDPVAGHIPGAINAPWAGNLDPATGRFLDVGALRERYHALGVDGERDVIAQCGSGVTACHDVLAIRLAGLGRARLCAGSWSGWVADLSRPVATGPEPGDLP